MTVTQEQRDEVRRRANFACEFCGVTETDTAGQLTIDHFKPRSKGGEDNLDNLLYACVRCNQFKQDYWPETDSGPSLWNPRLESPEQHFLALDDGTLISLTAVGEFTLRRLRLNRPPLVSFRQRKWEQSENLRLLIHYRNLVSLLTQLNQQLETLTSQQQKLLNTQRELLNILLGIEDD